MLEHLAGYIVDQSCAKKGKGLWYNAEVARCVREGDVLVTEDGKIFQISNISNQDKVSPELRPDRHPDEQDGRRHYHRRRSSIGSDYWHPVGPGMHPESTLMLSIWMVSPLRLPVTLTLCPACSTAFVWSSNL